MSFFKFRQGGADASAPPPSGKKPRGAKAAAASTESVEVMRRRARHRLIGSVVLVLAAVIGFPLVFDTKPRPVSGDIAIEIPARDTAAPLAPAANEATGKGLSDGEEEVLTEAPAQPASPPAPAPAAAPTPAQLPAASPAP
ncbi:MAG: SPOR domain-containing protein, partial [Comamonas sp.]